MNIPVEVVCVMLTAVIALQGWTLVEIVSLKVKVAHFDDLEKRVAKLEAPAIPSTLDPRPST